MNLREELIMLAEELAKIQERSPESVMRRCGGGPVFYQRTKEGRDFRDSTAQRVRKEMLNRWPLGLPLPKGIER